MNEFGGFQTGKTFLIERRELISRLERIRNDEGFSARPSVEPASSMTWSITVPKSQNRGRTPMVTSG